MKHRRTALMFLLLALASLATSSHAQENYVDFRVYVGYGSRVGPGDAPGQAGVTSNDRGGAPGQHSSDTLTNLQVRVQVINDNGSTVGESSPTNEGYAVFRVVGSIIIGQNTRVFPTYRVRVFGPEIEEAWAENVQPGLADRILNMTVHRKGEKTEIAKSGTGTVSASGLAVPSKAQKELDKGNEALSEEKFDKAKQHFEKAIQIYPQFDQAYNNLGVVLMKTGDKAAGKQAFEKALAVNDKSARAYVNLGKIAVQEERYDEALKLFTSSLTIEPLNSEAFNGICQAGVMGKDFEQVVSAAKKIHGMPHDNMPLCHFAAGFAYQNLNKPDEALAEYNLYLKEASMGDALVAKAREAIEEINKSAEQR